MRLGVEGARVTPGRALLLAGALALALALALPSPAWGQSEDVRGVVVNGTAEEATPAGLEVTLHAFGDGGQVTVAVVATDTQGRYVFQEVELEEGMAYAVTATYQGVLYSAALAPGDAETAVELLVFETTSSLELLVVEADALLLRQAGGGEAAVAAFEVVSLVNQGDRTFVPDLSSAGSMAFARFPTHPSAVELEVASDMPGGQVIDVGTGFALTSTVLPGAHQVSYTYTIPYGGNRLDMPRSFPMGAGRFRLLMDESLGDLGAVGELERRDPVDIEGTTLLVWDASDVPAGARMDLELTGLPERPLLDVVGESLEDGSYFPYLKVGIPAAVGLVLAGVLIYALVFRTPHRVVSATGGPAPARSELEAALSDAAAEGPQRQRLVLEMARLDDGFFRGEVDEETYSARRGELKARLLGMTPSSDQEGGPLPQGDVPRGAARPGGAQ